MNLTTVKFNRRQTPEFFSTLKMRVNEYFESRRISTFCTPGMVVKTVVMLGLYLVPYFLIIFDVLESKLLIFAMWALMGFGAAGIGLSVMHDANHGAYSRHKWVNVILGYLLNFLGGSATNWKMQHNVLHHSFTNVDGLDEDIAVGNLLRLSPAQPRLNIHRLQFLYAWFLYGLMTIMWVTSKDFRQLVRYKRNGVLAMQHRPFRELFFELILSKILYYAYILVLPLLLSSAPWWLTVAGFIAMHMILGFTLAIIFQPAHVVSETEFPQPDEKGNMENHWAIHQLLTTSNFAPKSRIFSWFVGGLNFQVEHHLLPNICHVHYKKLSKIVRETAEEYGLPYHVQPTFLAALWSHMKLLWSLGRPQRA